MGRYLAWMAGAALAAALTVAACGGGGSDSPTTPSPSPSPSPSPTPTPSPAPGNETTITISAAGVVSPKSITVSPGTRVTFVNNDTRVHDMNSDPHPAHTDCPEINVIGFLTAGQTRLTANLNTVRTCGYHDHNQDTNTNLQGTIIIR